MKDLRCLLGLHKWGYYMRSLERCKRCRLERVRKH